MASHFPKHAHAAGPLTLSTSMGDKIEIMPTLPNIRTLRHNESE